MKKTESRVTPAEQFRFILIYFDIVDLFVRGQNVLLTHVC